MTSNTLPDRTDADLGIIKPAGAARTKEDWIGNQLKKVYDEALSEDIPDDMLDLLSALDEGDNKDRAADDEVAK